MPNKHEILEEKKGKIMNNTPPPIFFRGLEEIVLACLRYVRIFYKKYMKYRGYKPAGRFGESLQPFVDWIKHNTTLEVRNIFEIGANFGQDADFLMHSFKISPKQVYVFEAHPEIYKAITKLHKFNAYNYAVFNEEKNMAFNIVPLNSSNTGISSIFGLKDNETKEVLIQSIRMDHFMDNNKIDRIDFLKLDVEGASYEVLEGFGDRLKDVQSMHIEAEHEESVFQGAVKLFDDISKLLKRNGFEMIYFQRILSVQSDSFWVKRDILKGIIT